MGDDPRALAVPILERLPDWVAHGAMWRILRRLYHATRLPQALEREPITDEAEIRRILTDWHANLAPEPVLARYRQELAQAQQLLPDEQLTRYVHGKRFYEAVVVQVLDRLFAGQGAPDWLARFRDAPIRPPADLCASLDWVFALP